MIFEDEIKAKIILDQSRTAKLYFSYQKISRSPKLNNKKQNCAERLIFIFWEEIMKITDTTSLGNAIRSRRKELKYTQGYISEITGLSVSFISDLENGKPTAEIGKTIEVINLLGLDILVEVRGDE